jgi:hypothetical protein
MFIRQNLSQRQIPYYSRLKELLSVLQGDISWQGPADLENDLFAPNQSYKTF